MKRNSLICLALTLIIVISALSVTAHFISAAIVPVLSIVTTGASGAVAGTTTNIPMQGVGTTFQVDVRIDNYASVNIGGTNNGVSAASYMITWDPAVLQYVSKVDASWLPSQNNAGDLSNKVTLGQLTIGQVAFDTSDAMATASSASGSVSVTITFKVLTAGGSSIALSQQPGVEYLSAPETVAGVTRGQPVTGTLTANAQYGTSTSPTPTPTPTPAVYGPAAIFTPTDGSTFILGSSIILNATSSKPGNDTQICNITSYAWSIEYLNGTTFASLNGQAPALNVHALGTFRIILIVTANDVKSPPSPSYVSTDSASAIINIVASQQSIAIDVFTDKGGTGIGTSSGIYGPLQLVQAYASVMVNNSAMSGESVLFTVQNANGSYYYRQGVTNQSGVATIQPGFRLPGPDYGSNQTSFGTWSITASVSSLGSAANDSTTFTLSYLSSIKNVSIPVAIHKGESMSIQLTIDNQETSGQWTQLSITLFDQAQIPIGSSTIVTTFETQNVTLIDTAITIPSWAFNGQATAYLCLLGNSTSVPIAPETIATFNILS
jgi:Cohesin domain